MENTSYPWLNFIYKNIIENYKKRKLHHTILIESYNIKNTYRIIWAVIRWILCHKKKNITNCGKCIGCILLKNNNHPDLYVLHTDNNNYMTEIKKIRNLLNIIKNTAQQNYDKILWIPNYQSLTIFGINALLKIIEEPPQNTFFFIGNIFDNKIHLTLKSRCILYKIFTPTKIVGLRWIQTNKIKKNCLISLRINNYDPEAAKCFLKKNNWIKRITLYKCISFSMNRNNFLTLLPQLNDTDILNKIYWIILLILDSLKFKKKLIKFLINTDHMQLIRNIAKKYSYNNLNNMLNSWSKCRYQLTKINNINNELLILKQLLIWQMSG